MVIRPQFVFLSALYLCPQRTLFWYKHPSRVYDERIPDSKQAKDHAVHSIEDLTSSDRFLRFFKPKTQQTKGHRASSSPSKEFRPRRATTATYYHTQGRQS
ncbi:hypothetical protein PM082_007183 [Marasmius tenuissimus]|nr:hypothetical protein PM082_007183 [Marasmius tenuissimus]